MELRAGQSLRRGVADFGHQSTGDDVGEGPVLIQRRREDVIAGGVERETGHRGVVDLEIG